MLSARWFPQVFTVFALLGLVPLVGWADGPKDNFPDQVRKIPPPGIALPEADRQELAKGVNALAQEIESLRKTLAKQPALLELLPDVLIFHKAVDYALRFDEFHDLKQIPIARKLLQQGRERAQQLREGKPAWTTATGLVVRGYVSKIDGSVQPYGLVVPASYQPNAPYQHRLDIWCHGRGETLTELAFLQQRQTNPGEFTPPHAFVLHPYGRYCNANKFAGEIDVLEALAHVQKHYSIDEKRIVMRGFSMGGAACWQFAVHYPSLWVAAAPGAGFSETPEFLNVFQKEKVEPTWYEKKLWRLYDCPGYADNLFNCPTVAYSGEEDRQKQAADVMQQALAQRNIELIHIIGPKTGHKYHPEAKVEINRRIDALAARGRPDLPTSVRFRTYTLRYNRSYWVTIDALTEHWEPATIHATLLPNNRVAVHPENVTAFTLDIPAGLAPFETLSPHHPPVVKVEIGPPGTKITPLDAGMMKSDRSWKASFRWEGGHWVRVLHNEPTGLVKRHGLQGPIDDAFMDRFVMVLPSGKPMNEPLGKFVTAESRHAITHWRQQFRGEAPVKTDQEITDADIASSHLVLWGDPKSNALLARLAGQLPIVWNDQGVKVGEKVYDSSVHVPIMIYPNPLNPKKYIVLNSGFTFREYDYLNNARQVPKLPDWAIVDASTPMTSRAPGKIVDAGFFDEFWKIPPRK